ncbi:MAG: hypothetical protein A2V88_05055 [Elusimicrobia bacterium RBG_16_66_12]|nr:MAG: hypothetical protein A2V88_05055 [Elusimicrobia bacterium RBG_16_66_12]
MQTLAYTIHNEDDETRCTYCSRALFVGNVAHTGPRGTYCSRTCAHAHDDQIKQARKEKQNAIRV